MSEARARVAPLGGNGPEVPMTFDERRRLERTVGALEQSNQRLRDEFRRAASQHARVASVLAACHRLHSTLDRSGMLIALHEVLAGLVGCEEAAVLEWREEPAGFSLAACFGIAERAVLPFPERVLDFVRTGRTYVGLTDSAAVPRRPGACVPLRVDGRVVGAIAIFRLADRKPGLSSADWDLLETLGPHVATALAATRTSPAVP